MEAVLSAHSYDENPITLKERQSLINVEHPFGLPIWKPALYNEDRMIARNGEEALFRDAGIWVGLVHPLAVLEVSRGRSSPRLHSVDDEEQVNGTFHKSLCK